MRALFHIIFSTIAVFATAYLLPGVAVTTYTTAFIVAIILGVLNVTLKPLILLLTFPITIITLGLSTLVVNALIILAAAWIVPGFTVASILDALVFGVILSVINWGLHALEKSETKRHKKMREEE